MARLTAAGVRKPSRAGMRMEAGCTSSSSPAAGAPGCCACKWTDGVAWAGAVETTSRAGADLIEIPLLHRRVLTLAEARDKCALLRKAALAGLDPVTERDRDRRGRLASRRR